MQFDLRTSCYLWNYGPNCDGCYTRQMKAVSSVALLLVLIAPVTAYTQDSSDFARFVAANDKFGRKLLYEVHKSNQDQNVAISPLPVSLNFGAILENSLDANTRDEISRAFEWRNISVRGPAFLLSQAFRAPETFPISNPTHKTKRGIRDRAIAKGNSGDGTWMRTAFIYRGRDTVNESFLKTAKRDFGTEIINTDANQSVNSAAKRWWKDYIPSPNVIGPSDFLAVGMTHVADVWRGNTFGRIVKDDFVLRTGEKKSVEMMPSEMGMYPHVRTSDFEAIVLSCWAVDLTIVLPAEGKDIGQIEEKLAGDENGLETMLRSELGQINLPKVHFKFQADFRKSLREMGVEKVFTDLDIVRIPKSHLKQVAQKLEIEINENGIRANAGTVMNGVYGGVMAGQEPFHMAVNRPFLFFIHDHLTHSPIFLGAVMDPSRQ